MARKSRDQAVDGAPALTSGGHSDRGSVRVLNEDSFLAASGVFAVADGMGGHAHGDLASQAAIAAFSRTFTEPGPARPQRVLDAIHRANSDVLALTPEGAESISGTTLAGVALVLIGPTGYHWMAFNVGDSRIYSWDGRRFEQLSVDHSAVQELVDSGAITRLQADSHPARNVVTRALGAAANVDPDIWLLPVAGHQTFVICSDGLTRELDDDEIARIIVFHNATEKTGDIEPMSLAERLVKAAVAAGGSDNVTVVVVESRMDAPATDHSSEETLDRQILSRFLEDTRPRV